MASVLVLLLSTALAQVGIGTNTPDGSAMLDVVSTSRGFLPPRLTNAQMLGISAPVAGLVVYNTTNGGLYYHNGSVWQPVAGAGGDDLGSHIATQNLLPDVAGVHNLGSLVLPFKELMLSDALFVAGQKVVAVPVPVNRNLAVGNTQNGTLSGADNLLVGYGAGKEVTTGTTNTLVGNFAGGAQVSASGVVALGYQASQQNISAKNIVAVGLQAGQSNQADEGTFVGAFAGQNANEPASVLVGYRAGFSATGGSNTMLGWNAGSSVTTGNSNTLLGRQAGAQITTGTANTMVGRQAGYSYTLGAFGNTFLGYDAGNFGTSGDENTLLGFATKATTGVNRSAAIGAYAEVTGSNSLVLGGTGAYALNVGIGVTAPEMRLQVHNGNLLLSNTTNTPGQLRFREGSTGGINQVSLQAPLTLGADYTLTLPPNDGNASEFLQTDGLGNLVWAPAGGGAYIENQDAVLQTANYRISGRGTIYGAFGVDTVMFDANMASRNINNTYGVYSQTEHILAGSKYAYYGTVTGTGTGSRFGLYNNVSSNPTTTDAAFGAYSNVTNLGPGNTYGFYANMPVSGGTGNRYGVYASQSTHNVLAGRTGVGRYADIAPVSDLEVGAFDNDVTGVNGTIVTVMNLGSGGTGTLAGLRFKVLNAGVANVYSKGGIFMRRNGVDGIGDLHFALNNAAGAANATIADTRVLIAAGGNVGIGAGVPSMSLDVTTPSLYSSPAIGGSNGASRWLYMHVSSAEHSLIWDNTSPLRFGVETTKGSGYSELGRFNSDGQFIVGNIGGGTGMVNVYNPGFYERSLYLENNHNSTGYKYGIFNNVYSSGTSGRAGIRNTVFESFFGSDVRGVENVLELNASSVSKYGYVNFFNGISDGNTYGVYLQSTGVTGVGSKYGIYSIGDQYNYFNGNVGINTSIPNFARLDIATSFAGEAFLRVSNASVFYANNSIGIAEPVLWPRWADDAMYMNYGSGGFYIRDNFSNIVMHMTNAQTVGIGTISGGAKLDVNGDIRFGLAAAPMDLYSASQARYNEAAFFPMNASDGIILENSFGESSGYACDQDNVEIWSPGDGGYILRFIDEDGMTPRSIIDISGSLVPVSDENAKQNIQALNSDVYSKLLALTGYQYEYKLHPAEVAKGQVHQVSMGVLAQEVQKLFPSMVKSLGSDAAGQSYIGVDYNQFVPVFIEAIKEQHRQIEALKAEVARLKRGKN